MDPSPGPSSRDHPLPQSAVARLLQSAVITLRAEVEALPEGALGFHPGPREWCVKEVLGHLIEAERRGFAGRIRVILSAPEPQLQAWDQDGVARSRRDCERPVLDLVGELDRIRGESRALVLSLREEHLLRGGTHLQVGFLRVIDLLHEWIHHDRNHLKQILTNVQGYVWPHMGNAQRFSGGRSMKPADGE